ncbi:uncharacterized protein LOC111615917 [Centruroides sculpturatus]|uniref:uncharacterized protein LOC111615917 n=1 Tax=Centruroides sculpturatus TaxID=218467 RepID=UPI000C6E05D5|nr:uncharacterized protein LOC111615917 [Centruroides sculpturatus]
MRGMLARNTCNMCTETITTEKKSTEISFYSVDNPRLFASEKTERVKIVLSFQPYDKMHASIWNSRPHRQKEKKQKEDFNEAEEETSRVTFDDVSNSRSRGLW